MEPDFSGSMPLLENCSGPRIVIGVFFALSQKKKKGPEGLPAQMAAFGPHTIFSPVFTVADLKRKGWPFPASQPKYHGQVYVPYALVSLAPGASETIRCQQGVPAKALVWAPWPTESGSQGEVDELSAPLEPERKTTRSTVSMKRDGQTSFPILNGWCGRW